ncbi:MAG: hypothetical protein RBS56_00905 [Candidatus Gracilibacteria bacterium]|nr:hypothetical protein [Candidatus Gracilibacteria bacterium]
MAKKRKIKFRLLYAVFPLIGIFIFGAIYFALFQIPQIQKMEFLDLSLRAWHIQNSLKEFFVPQDYIEKMSLSSSWDDLSIKFKEVDKSREKRATLFAQELSIIRKSCEENRYCKKSEFGLLAINNLEGFADALKNGDTTLAQVYDNNSTDFMRMYKYDIYKLQGGLDNLYLSRIVALGNADLLLTKMFLKMDTDCKKISEVFFEDPLFKKYCSEERIYGEIKEKTCYMENLLSGGKDCVRSKAYLKQILQGKKSFSVFLFP